MECFNENTDLPGPKKPTSKKRTEWFNAWDTYHRGYQNKSLKRIPTLQQVAANPDIGTQTLTQVEQMERIGLAVSSIRFYCSQEMSNGNEHTPRSDKSKHYFLNEV